MSLFTFLLDASVQNGYAILQAMGDKSVRHPQVREFKRRIAEAFVAPLMERNVRRRTIQPLATVPDAQAQGGGADSQTHVLLQNVGKKHVQCYLCKLMNAKGKVSKSMYSCASCRLSFHVNCFAFYHNVDRLNLVRPRVGAIVEQAMQSAKSEGLRKRKHNCSSNLTSTSVPFNL